jgi:hypothetical protein
VEVIGSGNAARPAVRCIAWLDVGVAFIGDFEQLNLEAEDGVGWNKVGNASLAISEMWSDDDPAPAADPHPDKTALQASDTGARADTHMAGSEAAAGVLDELATVQVELVVDADKATAFGNGTVADNDVFNSESGRLDALHAFERAQTSNENKMSDGWRESAWLHV